MKEAIAHLEFSIVDAGATVEVSGSAARIMGHTVLLRALFANLLTNALKFRRPDSPPRIMVAARALEKSGGVEMTVTDNGIGIPPEYREQVFGLFRRLHRRDDYPGTGVGLALCKRIVEQHGGTIGIEETPGGGCTVRFELFDARVEAERPTAQAP